MNRKYLKLGVLLVSLLAFFGDINSVMAGNNCGKKDKTTACFAFGEKTLMLTARNCDDISSIGSVQGLVFIWDGSRNTGFTFEDVGFTKRDGDVSPGYHDFISRVGEDGSNCPVYIGLNPDNECNIISFFAGDCWDAKALEWRWRGDTGGDTEAYNGGKNGFATYAIEEKYYNDVKSEAEANNNKMSGYVSTIRTALEPHYTLSTSNDYRFFETLPKTDVSLTKYSSKNKYIKGTFAAATPEKLREYVDEMGRDAVTLSNMSIAINEASNAFNAMSSLIPEKCSQTILEGSASKTEGTFLTAGASYDESINVVNKLIKERVPSAPEVKRTLMISTVKSCNKIASALSSPESSGAKFIEELLKIDAELAALEEAINDVLAVAEERKLAINMDNALEKIGVAKNELSAAEDTYQHSLDILRQLEFSINPNEKYDCHSLLGEDMISFLNTAYFFIEVAVVAIVVLLSMIDFTKSAAASDADSMKKAWKNLTTRIILIVVIVLLPVLVNFVIDLFNIKGIDPDNPICIIENSGDNSTSNEEV